VALLGAVPRDPALALPSRHLGLVQAAEHRRLEAMLERAAALVDGAIDTARLAELGRPARLPSTAAPPSIAPLGQRIAVARDDAFAFAYPTLLEFWRAAGVELAFFSPLADEGPGPDANAVYLPGGYPELHAGRLAGNACFLGGVREAASRGAAIHGECGGYMVLGEALIDAAGTRHAMLGLLPLVTSFAERRLHLGYREGSLVGAGPLGAAGARFRGHEFHYATIVEEGAGEALFEVRDAGGNPLGTAGRRRGAVCGSFLHLIDRTG
jgi:cobyrinic acid a,c-diamide synthase